MSQRLQVFAVLRFDFYLREDAPEEDRVTVKEVLASQDQAEREVERLNALVHDQGVKYVWQATRYFPKGPGGSAS